jgi:hypothetical protein
MSLERFEVGIVSGDSALVDFLADAFELDQLPTSEYPAGTLHRLQAPGAIIKVMVPNDPPTDTDGQPFLAIKGIRYLSMFVTDLDRVIERCIARGGGVLLEPFEFQPGSRLAIIKDPDGNTMEVTETA